MKLVIALNLLLLLALCWAWAQSNQSFEQVQSAERNLRVYTQHGKKILRLRQNTFGSVVAIPNHDCSKDIRRLLKKQNLLNNQTIRVNPARAISDSFAVHRIENPIQKGAQLDQILGFLLEANASEIRYFTSLLTLQAPINRGSSDQDELWNVTDLELRFMSELKDAN